MLLNKASIVCCGLPKQMIRTNNKPCRKVFYSNEAPQGNGNLLAMDGWLEVYAVKMEEATSRARWQDKNTAAILYPPIDKIPPIKNGGSACDG